MRWGSGGATAQLAGRRDGDATLPDILDFSGEVVQVHHHAVPQNTGDAGGRIPEGKKVQHKSSLVGRNNVLCVVPSLIAHPNVCVPGEQIDDAAFAFIAPVQTSVSLEHGSVSIGASEPALNIYLLEKLKRLWRIRFCRWFSVTWALRSFRNPWQKRSFRSIRSPRSICGRKFYRGRSTWSMTASAP